MFDTNALTTAAQAALDEAGAVLGVSVTFYRLAVHEGDTTATGFRGETMLTVGRAADGWRVALDGKWSDAHPTIAAAARSLVAA